MTADPDPSDDHWREEILNRMNRASVVLDRIEADEPYPVEPDSDLAGDREQVPDLWVDTLAARRLKVAVDYLAGVRDLVSGGTHFYAPFALLRAVLESSAAAVWLLEPADRKVRLQRLVGLHIDDTNNKKAVQFMLPEEFRDPFDHEPGIGKMVTDSGSPRGKCKFPDYTSVLKKIDDLPDEAGSMLLGWRVCSGFSHGLSWATTGLMPELNREQIGTSVHRVETSANYQLVSSIVNTAVRTIERADCLFTVRQTARPHEIKFNFTRD
ncbi:hypothetical protein [Rhodococcus globerulus]|uniref:Uncharacterized protein n=1 Tax=Rhodococcus globerulus TaxID=33008 RepID=A0ABU4BU61_RHOGO|nr:hypothetical protein [Rhodococcus globerulus]MDV6267757.1 hypothetical protein [Rhodococcus globerulus]